MKIQQSVFAGIMVATVFTVTAQAFPIIEWNTVSLTYGIENMVQSHFGLHTENRDGDGASILGAGESEASGLWTILTATDGTAGISQWWFPVQYGELIDIDSLTPDDPLAIINISQIDFGSIQLNSTEPFYLGFCVGYPQWDYADYGWVELLFDGETVSAVSSATERTGLGIYAGTGTAIPEPTTAGLLLIGATGFAWLRWMRKRVLSR